MDWGDLASLGWLALNACVVGWAVAVEAGATFGGNHLAERGRGELVENGWRRQLLRGEGFELPSERTGLWPTVTVRCPGVPGPELRPRTATADAFTGDPAFDAAFSVQGGVEALVLLDDATRAALRALVDLGADVRLAGGELVARARTRASLRAGALLEVVLRAAAALRQPREPLRPTLAARVLRDPDEGHARRCLAALVGLDADDGPESPTAREVAAQVLATRAEPALLADASAIAGEPDAAITLFERADLGAHTRGRALATLAEVAPDRAAALARDLITRAVEARGRGPDRPLLPACLDLLLEAGDPAAVDLVGRVLDVPDDVFRLPLMSTLGRRGTVALVPRLTALYARRGGRHADAARAAVRSIQGRVEGAAPGQLSLADGDAAGGLSVAAEGGGVSLARSTAAARAEVRG